MDKPAATKLLRCAIYTRKSTEHNLDLEFNSLHAQREACEAYINSQAHEGWRLLHHRFDDGAFSGASLERPALQGLLTEVRAGRVDVIVVYKVDRLTRSLSDFVKLIELFDQHSVSFVSVTQSFNTTTSMGRLTLNVLLSFAQFEREVIGERVRDKIAASKAKGLWVGGSIPLGYASINKKLVVVPKEAETVRLIFRRYLELGSIRDLAEDLDRQGIRTRCQTLSTGQIRGGIRFGVGALAHLLRNRFYIGEVVYRRAVHLGEHEAILHRSLFDAVQVKLAASANDRQLKLRASPSILAGRIFEERGGRMTPTHANKNGARYRYYISHTLLQKRNAKAASTMRVPAHEIERAVTKALRDHIRDSGADERSGITDRELVEGLVDRIVVTSQTIEIQLCLEAKRASESATPTVLTVAWRGFAAPNVKGILHSPSTGPPMIAGNRDVLLTAIAKARAWIADLAEGRVARLSGNLARRRQARVESGALLGGLIFDDRGNRMSPTYTVRRKNRYRYYISQAQLRGGEAGSRPRIAANDVERVVVEALCRQQPQDDRAADMDNGVCSVETRELVRRTVDRVVIHHDAIAITIKGKIDGSIDGDNQSNSPKTLRLALPRPRLRERKEILVPGDFGTRPRRIDQALILALARASSWMRALRQGEFMDTAGIAQCFGLSDAHVRRLLRFAYLAPDIVEAVIEGRQPRPLTVKLLLRGIPLDWADQRAAFGFR